MSECEQIATQSPTERKHSGAKQREAEMSRKERNAGGAVSPVVGEESTQPPQWQEQMQQMQQMIAKMQKQMQQQRQENQQRRKQQEEEQQQMRQQYEQQLQELRGQLATAQSDSDAKSDTPEEEQSAAAEAEVLVGLAVAKPGEVVAAARRAAVSAEIAAQSSEAEEQQQQQEGGVQPQRSTAVELRPPRLSAVEPKELKHKEARTLEVLDEWVFKANHMLDQQGLMKAPFAEQLTVLSRYWDRDMTRWWKSISEARQQQRKPIDSWEALQQALHSSFLSTGAEDAAFEELCAPAMKQEEDMPTYVGRMAALFERISRVRLSSEIAAEFLAGGVSALRFPTTVATYKKEQKEHRREHFGKGMDFHTVRERLIDLALAEPSEVEAAARRAAASAGSSSGSSGGSKSSSGGRGQSKTVIAKQVLAKKLNALVASIEGASADGATDGLSEEEQLLLNALVGGEKGGSRCFRCRSRDHVIADCPKPDSRVCFNCGEKGHVVAKCGKPKKPRQEGEAAPGGPKSKNG